MEENQQIGFDSLTENQQIELILQKLHEAVNIMLCAYPPPAVGAIVSSLRASLFVQFGEEIVDKNFEMAVESYREALPEMRKEVSYEEALKNNHTPLALPGTSFSRNPQFVYPIQAKASDIESQLGRVTEQTKLIH